MITSRMKSIQVVCFMVAMVLTIIPLTVAAGDLNAPGAPGADASKSFNLQDLYNRLDSGAAGTQRSFTEPTAGPTGPTMHSINTIMGKAPAVDNAAGASAGDVLQGKKFWGLRSGNEWGPRTGTMPNMIGINESLDRLSEGTTLYVFPAQGYYPPFSSISVTDPNYTPQNIKFGVNIFGKTGTYKGCSCSGALFDPRWCDNGDGTVTDMLGYEGKGQCLVWLKEADCFTSAPWRADSGYDDAHTRAGTLSSGNCGLSDGSILDDWRLPTQSELESITSGLYGVSSGTQKAFIGIHAGGYWSSTSLTPPKTDTAWFVDLSDRNVGWARKDLSNYIWPVRNGR